MIFTHGSFWLFFAVLLLGYSFAHKGRMLRSSYLLAFSLFFYYKSSGLFFVLLLFTTLRDYLLGILIAGSAVRWKRRLLLAISVALNLAVLSYFKYTYFFADSLNALLGIDLEPHNYLSGWSNALLGTSLDVSQILLPVGISFFTFQTISYTVDVYRGKLQPVRNIIDFGFYVSFFPQLVAGPIVRAAEFIPQLYPQYRLTTREFGYAIFLILNGMVKKVVISDYISINFVDRVFDSPLSYSGLENLLAIYGYSLQIYCDFSGYSDMAIGLALLLGFRLPLNFNSPYKAVSITDFWRRWHISLSTWLRDYLYIPLGGSRRGQVATYINLMITMLLGGLWHGANLRFVVWGGIHGLALVAHKLWVQVFPRVKPNPPGWRRFLGAFITFNLVSLSWIFFRAESMPKAWGMLQQIYERFGAGSALEILSAYAPVLSLMFLAFAFHWIPVKWKEWYRGVFISTHISVKIVAVLAVAFVVLQVQSADIQPFIYFKF